MLIALLSAIAACAGDARELHLYTSLDAQEAPAYIEAFERDTGIRVSWVRLSAGEALARLEAEKRNPQVSVWFGGPSAEYIVAAGRDLLEPFEPSLEFVLEEPARAPDWAWMGFYSGVLGFICNDDFLRERGATCPRTWDDLLAPPYTGQISMAYPYTSGTAYVQLVGLLSLKGDAGWDYIRRLDAQVHHYNSSGTAAVTQTGLGEVGVGIAFAHDILKKGVERGYPVSLSLPMDGSPSEIGAVALIRGGPEPELAQQFVTWLLSERAQNLLAAYYRVPLNPRATVADEAVQARSVRIVEYDAAAAAFAQSENLARWRQITGR